jgi:hypothetical protein
MMKTIITLTSMTCIAMSALISQTTSDFEFSNLGQNEYWNGSDEPGGTSFQSGNAFFPNDYDTAFGGYWASGWAYSNMQNDSIGGFANQYSAIAANGFQSETYAVGQQDAVIQLEGTAQGGVANGMYITNSTYAALSMRDGDFFGKVFGDSLDASGNPDGTNGEDFYKLTIRGCQEGQIKGDSVEFYLADYRFSDDNLDYIIEDWTWVNLKALGNVDSLSFTLRSSDVGFFGMNTPAFFCLDNFTTADQIQIDTTTALNNGDTIYIIGGDSFELFDGNFVPLSLPTVQIESLKVYPNPTIGILSIESTIGLKSINLLDNLGRSILQHHFVMAGNFTLDLESLQPGPYLLQVKETNHQIQTHKIIKR